MLVVLFSILAWLNGPGLRWLAPQVAGHYLKKAGMRGSFTVEGSFTGGISVKDLHIESDAELANLTIRRMTPDYRFRDLIGGRLNGISVEGLHAEMRSTGNAEMLEESRPFEADELVRTLRGIREKLIPMEVDLRDISFKAERDGKPVISLAPSAFHHKAGKSAMRLNLGAITDANGRVWPAQESAIDWEADDFSIDQVDPLPGLSIRDLVLRLPVSGGPSLQTEVHLGGTVLEAETTRGFSSVRIDLREGRLSIDHISRWFAVEIPAKAEVTSLSVDVKGLMPDPMAATGSVRLSLEDVAWQNWVVPKLLLDVELESGRATVAASGQTLGCGLSLNAEAALGAGPDRFNPRIVTGHFNVAEVSLLVATLAGQIKVIDPQAPVPRSSADGDFSVALKDGKPVSTDLKMLFKPEDSKDVSPVFIKGRWQDDQTVVADIDLDGVKIHAGYQLESGNYEAKADLEKFESSRIDRWLAIVKADTHGAVRVTGAWSGSGDIKHNNNRGNLTVSEINVIREGLPPANASGDIHYDWPAAFQTKNLRIVSQEQTIATDAKLANGVLEIFNLSWRNGDAEIAGGSAKIPVPDDFSKWRDMLINDNRLLAVEVESKVHSLAILKPWLPAAAMLDAKSTGMAKVMVSGTCAAPEIDVQVDLKNLRSPEQPKLPPADIMVKVTGRNGHLSVEGRANTPDFAPALITASMPFLPAIWAKNPQLIQDEKITARLDLPRIDLSRFGSLVADARKVSGILTGNVDVTGVISKPVIKGRIDLKDGGIEMKGNKIPSVTGLGASVDMTPDRVNLTNLKASLAGGTLQVGGSLKIDDGKPGALDLRISGNHLPLMRNESLILRANADLRLSGTLGQAALTGKVGVVDSLFYRDIELLPMGLPFIGPSVASLPKIDAASVNPGASMPEPFRHWTINVIARTENPFLIRGNLATGHVDVNLRVGGTFGSPAPDGEVKISEIKAALPFSTLKVASGHLRYTPATGLDPTLEIRGTAEPRPYRVNVFAYGRLSNPQLVLTSMPPLPENEIMTLLATGTTTAGLENPQAASSRAMQLLAEELRRGRFIGGKQLRPALSLLDRVDFSLAEADPYSSESFSTATVSLTDRWFVSAGMGAERDSRMMVVWRISFR